jgi:hypothetical protein
MTEHREDIRQEEREEEGGEPEGEEECNAVVSDCVCRGSISWRPMATAGCLAAVRHNVLDRVIISPGLS